MGVHEDTKIQFQTIIGARIACSGEQNCVLRKFKEEHDFRFGAEEESEQLNVVREDEGLNLWRGYYDAASCLFKNETYAFKTHNYEEVHRYSLETRKWSLFYSQHK